MPFRLDELGFPLNLIDLIPLDEWISTQELISFTDFSASAISQRLLRLRGKGLVKRIKRKRQYFYQRVAVEA